MSSGLYRLKQYCLPRGASRVPPHDANYASRGPRLAALLVGRIWPISLTPRAWRSGRRARQSALLQPIQATRAPTPAGTPHAGSGRRWYRSLYWRIAAGFIASLAVMLLAQVGLFLWVSSERSEAMPPQLLADLTNLVAGDLSDALARNPSGDLSALAKTRFEELGRPAALVLADGRVVAAGFEPPAPAVRLTVDRINAGDADGWRRFGVPGARFRRRFPVPPPDGEGPASRERFPMSERGAMGQRVPIGPPFATAPVHADGRVVAAVMVARGRPLGAVARELAPWLAAGLAALLLAGTVLASIAVFRPAQHRLRDLEDAARRFGEGDLAARASPLGGDEVAAVARAFNRMADEAAARQAALVDADRARRQLLADVTHELRTPLTAIRGYAETLTLPAFAPISEQGRHAVHVVDVEAQRLERLVNDLLDLARFDAGGAALEHEAVSVAALFTRVVERHGLEAEAAQVALATGVGPGAETIVGDARRLEQVLQNLTANALRHTPEGGHVRLDARRDADAIVLAVRDDGAGIPAAHLPHVFDRFYKADPARADASGTGLGLSIAKAIVDRHGGTIAVASTPGVETVFSIRIPLSRPRG